MKNYNYNQKRHFFRLSAPQMQIYQMIEGGYEKAGTISASMFSEKYRDVKSMKCAMIALFESFSVFRLRIGIEDGKPVQWIDDHFKLKEDGIRYLDFARQEDFDNWADEEARKPLPLSDPLFDFSTVCVNGRYGMFVRLSHIISDGLSLHLLANCLDKIYVAKFIENVPLCIEEYPYMEMVEEENKYRTSEKYQNDLNFWEKQIQGGCSFISLSDKKRKGYQASRLEYRYSIEESRRTEDFCKNNYISEYVLFYGILGMYVSAMTGEEDFFFGTNLLNRTKKQQSAIGMYVTTNLLRYHYDGEKSCRELLTECKKAVFNTIRHGKITYPEIMEEFRYLTMGNSIDFMFNYQNGQLSDSSRTTTWHHNGHSQQSISISMRRQYRDNLEMIVDYDPSLYSQEDIDRMYHVVTSLLEQIIENPDAKVKELRFCSKEDEKTIMTHFNNSDHDYLTGDKTIISFFEDSVKRFPEKMAVLFGDHCIAYREFNRRVNVLAHKLRRMGVSPNSIVAVCMDRSDRMLAGIFAIVKAGGAYMPVSTAIPSKRMEYMLKDSNAGIIFYDGKENKPDVSISGVTMIDLSDSTIWDGLPGDEMNPEPVNNQNDPVYVIYTSGTTGNPKGVVNGHKGLLNRILWMNRRYPIGKDDVVLQKTVFTFDVSVWEIFWWSMFGATVILPAQGDEKDPALIADAMQNYGVTVMHFVPTMLDSFLQYVASVGNNSIWNGLKYVFSSGEALHVNTVDEFYRTAKSGGARLINVYGPTEASIDVTYYDCAPGEQLIPIGKPIDNIKIYIVRGSTLCGIGVPGEILITGVGLASGYLNNRKLTDEKFIDNPFGGGKAYRTGDCGAWLSDGNIRYFKRFDTQIKIHGQRLEIGEVESALLALDVVREGTVICRKNEQNENVLYGYYVSDIAVKPIDVQKMLARMLPGYMIPRYMMQIDRLPFTAHGKLDRKALPEISQITKADYAAPQTKQQILLVEAIEKVLGLEGIGLNDDFISLGGDSISGIRVISELRRAGMSLSVRGLIEGRIVKTIASYIETTDDTLLFRQIREGFITGTPLINGFLGYGLARPEHYNQSVSIKLDEADPKKIRKALDCVVRTHDMLRAVVRKDGEIEKLYIRSTEEETLYDFSVVETNEVVQDDQRMVFDLANGPLLRVILNEAEKRITFIGHHLIVDAVSWGVVIPDFLEAYEVACHEDEPILPTPTTPFAAVADMVTERIQNGYYSSENAYWHLILKNAEPLSLREKTENESHATPDRREITILTDGSGLDGWCENNDISMEKVLLTALARGYRQITASMGDGSPRALSVLMENNGRMFDGPVSLERSVGWFTVFFPVNVLATAESFEADLERNCHSLETVPSNGFGFAPYMLSHGAECLPSVLFNYLGQALRYMGKDVRTDNVGKTIADENIGESIMINIFKKDDALETVFEFDCNKYLAEDMENWVNAYSDSLSEFCKTIGTNDLRVPVVTARYGFTDLTASEYRNIVEKFDCESVYALTGTQKGLLLHLLSEEKTGDYQIQLLTRIPNDLSDETILAALQGLAGKYDVFRTVINLDYSEPCALVLKNSGIEYSVKQERVSDAGVERLVSMDRERGFDLKKDSLARVSRITTESGNSILLWNFNHIIMDGWSLPIVLNDFMNGCRGRIIFDDSACRYSRYAALLNKRAVLPMREHWRKTMSGAEGGTAIEPLNRRELLHKAGEEILGIKKNTVNKLEEFCRQHALTMNSVFEGTMGILLSHYSGQENVVFASMVSGRQVDMEGIENLVGMCAHVVPANLNINEESRVSSFLHDVQTQTLESFRFDYGTLSDMSATDKDGNSLLHIIYAFENYDLMGKDDMGDFGIVDCKEQTEYDMALRVQPNRDSFDLQILWHGDRISSGQPASILRHWALILDTLAEQGDVCVKEIPLSTNEERENVLSVIGEAGVCNWPRKETAASLFKKAATAWPDRPAIVFEGRTVDYRILDHESDLLAAELIECGIAPGDYVALFCERSVEMIVGMYAVAKTGAAYVPINTIYPRERVDYIISDCKPKALLYYGVEAPENTPALTYRIELGKFGNDRNAEEVVSDRIKEIRPEDVLYVIYTSGTTGNPKGVQVENRNLVRLLFNDEFAFDFTEKDVWTLFHSYGFDFSVWEMYGAGLRGGRLVVVPEEVAQNSIDFVELIARERVTVLNQVPSAFYSLMSVDDPQKTASIRYLIFGGETLRAENLSEWHKMHPDTLIVNMYGITETTVHVTYQEIGDKEIEDGNGAIGVAIPTTQIYLERGGRLCGTGIPGEICVAGDGVARGYLNRPELTEKRFTDNPYGQGRLYHSGDLAKWDAEGKLYYLGRIDQQVQIHGFRVEIGDVEHALLRLDAINECVVIDNKSDKGDVFLTAYYTSDEELIPSEIRNGLKETIPGYMIPSFFIRIEQIPTTVNGKLDKKRLREITAVFPEKKMHQSLNTKREVIVATAYSNVLGIDVESIGRESDFFSLGGDSIKALRVVTEVRNSGYELKVRDILSGSVLSELAEKMVDHQTAAPDYRIRSGEMKDTPIVRSFFDAGYPNPNHYNQTLMFEDINVDKDAFKKALYLVANHHELFKAVVKGGRLYQNETIPEHQIAFTVYENMGDRLSAIPQVCEKLQTGLDVERGPMISVALFMTGETDYIMMAVHHLLIDGVSWRILLHDLRQAYGQILSGTAVTFAEHTASYVQWADEVNRIATSDLLDSQIPYWTNVVKRIESRYADCEKKDTGWVEYSGPIVKRQRVLDNPETEMVLKKCAEQLSSSVEDILLGALASAFRKTVGDAEDEFCFELESQGREGLPTELPLDRTVGWFTAIYPCVVKLADDELKQVLWVKEMKQSVPGRGVGYGVLGMMGKVRTVSAPIRFNYLGDNRDTAEFRLSPISSGEAVATENITDQVCWDMICLDGKLSYKVVTRAGNDLERKYSSEDIIDRWFDNFETALQKTVLAIETEEKEIHTPHDYEVDLTWDEFEAISNDFDYEDMYPLTPTQMGMLYQKLAQNNVGEYVIQSCIEVHKPFDEKNAEKALELLGRRYPVLRTRILFNQSIKPIQIIDKNLKLEFTCISCRKDEVEGVLGDDVRRGFELDKDSLIRLTVLRLDDNSTRLVWTMHHIIMDGWCLSLIFGAYLEYYSALEQGREVTADKTAEKTFGQFVRWSEKQDTSFELRFWKEQIKDYENENRMPEFGGDPATENLLLIRDLKPDQNVVQKVNEYTEKNNVTANAIFEAVWSVVLSQYTGSNDVVFGIVNSGRSVELPGIENTVGLFIRTLPLRTVFDDATTASALIKCVHGRTMEVSENGMVELGEILKMNPAGNELFDTLFVFENYYMNEKITENKDFTVIQNREQTNYGITFRVYPDDGYKMEILADPKRFGSDFVDRLLERAMFILRSMMEKPDYLVNAIPLCCETEERMILNDFNGTDHEYPAAESVVELFEKQVALTPNAPALAFMGERLTYGEFNRRVNLLAHELLRRGYGHGDYIGVCIDRSFEMMIGIFAVVKIGAAYIPMDTSYPEARIRYILSNACARCVLVNGETADRVDYGEIDKIVLIRDMTLDFFPNGTKEDEENPDVDHSEEDPIYVIYTSGTTGQPKGVVNLNKGLLNRIRWMQKEYPIGADDVILQKTVYTFDVSVWELFWWSMRGAALHLMEQGDEKDPRKITEEIVKGQATTVHFVPTVLDLFLSELEEHPEFIGRIRTLKYVFSSGEALKPDTVKTFHSVFENGGPKLINVYGPTEASIDVSFYECRRPEDLIPIGKPIDNIRLYIVNKGRLCNIGMPGELVITGVGVAREYINNPEQTADKFKKNPYGEGMMYYTGDLCSWMPDGNIQYHHRIDNQIKIHGQRVELGEIESAMRNVAGIRDAAVIITARGNDVILCGFYVSNLLLEAEEIKISLSEKLAKYMIPNILVPIDRIPFTSHGKLDRKSLEKLVPETMDKRDYVAPVGKKEELVAGVFEKVLACKNVSRTDDFYSLGGDSIKAMRILSGIRAEHYSIAIKDIMKYRTVELLAAHLKAEEEATTKEQTTGAITQLPIQKQFFDWDMKNHGFYNQAIMLKLKFVPDVDRLCAAFDAVTETHSMLRCVWQSETPVILPYEKNRFYTLEKVDLTDVTERGESPETAILKKNNSVQRGIDIETGPLVKAVLYRIGTEHFELFICVHHLVMDAYSWRVLISDLELAYGEDDPNGIGIPRETCEFCDWSTTVMKSVRDPESAESFWNRFIGNFKEFRRPDKKTGLVGTGIMSRALSNDITESLRYDVPPRFNVTQEDLILTGIKLTLDQWKSSVIRCLDIENQGRTIDGLQVANDRTVGWFTVIYPFTLDLASDMSVVDAILSVKEEKASIRPHMHEYGVLYSLGLGDERIRNKSAMLFNYLGVLDDEYRGNEMFAVSEYAIGDCADPNIAPVYPITVDCSIVADRLEFNVKYDASLYTNSEISEFLQLLSVNLESIVEAGKRQSEVIVTRSDLGEAAIDMKDEDLDVLDSLLTEMI